MAASLAVVLSNKITNSVTTMGAQWEIHFARFFSYPSLASTCSDLVPLAPNLRNRRPKGNWISSSSVALLCLINDHKNSDVILTVSFNGKCLEEHYVSKLHFSWPQVSCVSGFPPRGIRTVLVSFRDPVGEIEKFALRFASICETQSFINVLKELLKDAKDPEPLNTDFGSEISSQSVFVSSNKHPNTKDILRLAEYCRARDELSILAPVDTYTPQMPLSLNKEGERYSRTEEKENVSGHNFQDILPALPPSFTSLLMDCSENKQAQPTVSKENDLKCQIAKYMEDSSFQDILAKVEKVISEIGEDMSL